MWYTIITVLFRCPSSSDTTNEEHPTICKPYLSIKSLVEPFVGPYYDTYASPYVEKAKPYVDTANTRIIKPATVLAISNYDRYAAPQVSKAREYTVAEWERRGLPQFKKAQDAAQQIYDQNLAPHVQKVSEVTSPYYDVAKENALNIHEKHVLPAIALSQPHVQSFGVAAQKFFLEKVVPNVRFAWTNVVIFVDGTLWPFIKKIYADNVRPQLVMIGERIAKYQEGRKLHSAMEEVDRSETTSVVSDTNAIEDGTTMTTTTTSSTTTISDTTSSSAAPTYEPDIATDETINEDLVKWQKKFLVAADKGTDDLKDRIDDIVNSLTSSELSDGEGLATALEKTAEVEIATVKAKINSVASTLPEDADATVYASAEAELVQAVSDAGARCKEKAKNMRVWAKKFEKELHQRAGLATESTVQVLDDIRDLGLQEIGMRWAWMEGVTYKHWQKYHELKKQFANWRNEVTAAGLEHPALTEAREKAKTLLEESMAVTEDSAKELSRLKDVLRWKVASRDSSDDFDSRALPVVAPALSAASSMVDNVKQAVVGSTPGSIESLASAASSSASSYVAGTTGNAEAAASSVSSAASGMSEGASSVILGSTNSAESAADDISNSASGINVGASSEISSAMNQASDAAQVAASSASSIVLGSTGSGELIASSLSKKASNQYSSATSLPSSIASSATAGPSEGILSSASSLSDSISTAASSVLASASASEKLKQAVDEAGEEVADFTSSLRNTV